ncbi:hydrolase 2, exosortase A system-associated [Accumulibacter sp.]|uniref:hydrolase 2, exosortase A system-associated n=1 Tax=Accumulibacter sp. TaxID=2053492 RepID=UPI0025DFE258|nr:hydrolase 2, exosortase A system-associated [Accumulibacter sp.]MCM8594186.1 hydrolase 2, exosortase A system-associated [Accumulibacter sp.]MCM8625748.1 hydrolase 2, exosortase A system-associated [Accumulibacter sp.]MDS4048329.1 hydrolase 2, exosortase A system-associated [Accumulibacter sp.]
MALEAFFLPACPGRRFALLHLPDGPAVPIGAVVFVPPFAEELNKSRRMVALQSRALAAAGYAVLQVDPLGCGDSSGDFAEATWESWLADVDLACAWLERRITDAPLWLWGLRTGCLLANDAANRMSRPVNLLFWQPVLSGKQFLQQFLRLKLAAELLGGESKGVMERARAHLRDGQAVEVAGYLLSSVLAAGLEKADLLLPHRSGRVEWIEISGKAEATLSPAAQARLAQWHAAGQITRSHLVGGPQFWQTSEIAECPELIETTLGALAGVA